MTPDEFAEKMEVYQEELGKLFDEGKNMGQNIKEKLKAFNYGK